LPVDLLDLVLLDRAVLLLDADHAVVEMPTTIAVRISTCGSGLENTASVTPSWKIGAVPPLTLPIVM